MACRAGHEGAEVELADPDAATVRCAHQDVAIGVGDQDLVTVVAPLEVADGGPPVVDQLHDGPAIVVTPHNDRPRRITQRKNLIDLGHDLGNLDQDLMHPDQDSRFLAMMSKILPKKILNNFKIGLK